MFLGCVKPMPAYYKTKSVCHSEPACKESYVNNYTSQSIYLSVILSQLGRRKPHGAREESLLRQ
jgi:hypothetical protein